MYTHMYRITALYKVLYKVVLPTYATPPTHAIPSPTKPCPPPYNFAFFFYKASFSLFPPSSPVPESPPLPPNPAHELLHAADPVRHTQTHTHTSRQLICKSLSFLINFIFGHHKRHVCVWVVCVCVCVCVCAYVCACVCVCVCV